MSESSTPDGEPGQVPAPSDAASPPAPLPLPGPAQKPPRRRVWPWIVGGIFLLLLGCGVLSAAALPWMIAQVERVSEDSRPKLPDEVELRKHAAVDYPRYTFEDFMISSFTPEAGGPLEHSGFITLKSKDHPGFTIGSLYAITGTGPPATRRYEVLETFFSKEFADAKLVDSFAQMWMREHPDEICTAVSDGVESLDVVEYEVNFGRPDGGGGYTLDEKDVYRYTYDPATNTWSPRQ